MPAKGLPLTTSIAPDSLERRHHTDVSLIEGTFEKRVHLLRREGRHLIRLAAVIHVRILGVIEHGHLRLAAPTPKMLHNRMIPLRWFLKTGL